VPVTPVDVPGAPLATKHVVLVNLVFTLVLVQWLVFRVPLLAHVQRILLFVQAPPLPIKLALLVQLDIIKQPEPASSAVLSQDV